MQQHIYNTAAMDAVKVVLRTAESRCADTPVLILDQAVVGRQYRALARALPGVRLHYALKPLPHEAVVTALIDCGSAFDLATSGEIELVERLGVDPEVCIHSHPIKSPQEIKRAIAFGVKRFVADNRCEIAKFAEFSDCCELMIRIAYRNPEAKCDLSRKFGCEPEDALSLLAYARTLGVRVAGFSFHVGSQVSSPKRHVEAINQTGKLVSQAREAGFNITFIDIGGGFPVDYEYGGETDIETFCAPIRQALDNLPDDLDVLAEPGRFIAASCMASVSTVVGVSHRDGKPWYYLNDGVYGSFSGQIFDHVIYPKFCLKEGERTESVLAGPTCDSIDIVSESIMLPQLKPGDRIVSLMMGAYTWVSSTTFNSLPLPEIMVIDSEVQQGRKVTEGFFVPANGGSSHWIPLSM